MRKDVLGAAVALAVNMALGGCARAGYQGLYFHSFTGTAIGTEWATWRPLPGEGRYEFADLKGAGAYPGTISPDGRITLDFRLGTGQFAPDGTGVIHFDLGGGTRFESSIRRAPFTSDDFPVVFTDARVGDESLSGAWDARVRDIDPATGGVLGERSETMSVVVDGTTVRLTSPDGEYVQGVWMGDDLAGFRFVEPPPRQGVYRTFPGSQTSHDLNLVGELRVTGANAMALTVFFETRGELGTQVQTAQRIELTRVPAPAGAGVWGAAVLVVGGRRRIHRTPGAR